MNNSAVLEEALKIVDFKINSVKDDYVLRNNNKKVKGKFLKCSVAKFLMDYSVIISEYFVSKFYQNFIMIKSSSKNAELCVCVWVGGGGG